MTGGALELRCKPRELQETNKASTSSQGDFGCAETIENLSKQDCTKKGLGPEVGMQGAEEQPEL